MHNITLTIPEGTHDMGAWCPWKLDFYGGDRMASAKVWPLGRFTLVVDTPVRIVSFQGDSI